ncbi:MAG: hypothetical protein EOO20_16025 [Chryseobacterium sp.]|nr:MAG: hypothetical protein EOO20_16025 [Chryseobacterium sp.]
MRTEQLSQQNTKIDFISDLLKAKKITALEKERIFNLIAKEFENFGKQDSAIIAEIEAIKSRLGYPMEEENISIDEPAMVVTNNLPIYLNPEGNAKFLMELNQNPILKSITHNVDSNLLIDINEVLGTEEYDFNKHIGEIKIRYKRLSHEFKGKTSKGLAEKTYAYIFGNAAWSEDKIRMSWSSPTLLKWAIENPNQCPNATKDVKTEPFTFSRILIKSGEHLKTMRDLVRHYKKQISIRSENSLKDLCEGWNIEFEGKANINLTGVKENIEFFTDVEKLNQAYRKLIELCIEADVGSIPEIELSLIEEHSLEMTKVIFSIWHKNSVFKKSKGFTIERYGQTFTGLINNQLNGLCNWNLEADFGGDDYAKLSIWPHVKTSETIEKFQGVRHNLIFNY